MAPGGGGGARTRAPAPDPRWFRCGRTALGSFSHARPATEPDLASFTSRHPPAGEDRHPPRGGPGRKEGSRRIRDVEALDRAGHFKTPDHVAARARALPQALAFRAKHEGEGP